MALLDGVLYKFLTGSFLRWLETLSLLGDFRHGLESIPKLLHAAEVC
jgi:hypothetical protein